VSLAAAPLGAEARLFLRDEELDAALELFVLAEAALATAAEAALDGETNRMGRGHWRAVFLLKRRPGLGVQDLARLTGLSKQGASRVLRDLETAGYIEKSAGAADARRRPARLTTLGAAFEDRVSERLRHVLTRAYRTGGLDAVGGAHRILAAVAGPRNAPRDLASGGGS
jgi:DNA-binding MarR family transcriptional regulator